MQVYVHRDGQNLGPYSIGQLRPYLQAGNFTGDDLACLDGVNWVALKDVPGIVDRKSKPVPQARTTPEEPVSKPNKKPVILLAVGILFVSLFGISAYFLLKNERFSQETSPLTAPGRVDTTSQPTAGTSSPGEENLLENSKPMPSTGFLEIRPKQVVEVYDGDTFKIDLQGVHPLFGDKLPIRVKGIDTPELRGTTEEIKALAEQARELTENTLKGAAPRRSSSEIRKEENTSGSWRKYGWTAKPWQPCSRKKDWPRITTAKGKDRNGKNSFSFPCKFLPRFKRTGLFAGLCPTIRKGKGR